jgi:CubicO group peptidase (beta-lactamase class C family)
MFRLRFAALLLTITASFANAADLPRATPESQGVNSAAILEFIEAADKNLDSLNSIIVVRHGHVISEGCWAPYSAQSPHSLYSLSKSFTSTAIGIAISEGILSLDDEVIKFFPEDLPEKPSANLKLMRISDLLRMSTGQQTEPPRKNDESWVKTFLAHPVPFKPGTHFQYNTPATYMLSAILQKVTSKTLLEYLKPRLFEPLGIENPTWELSPQGISTGGYGLSIRTEDIAKFGQLYLQKGKWNGKQLVPAAWIDAATARQTSNGSNPKSDWDQGYGYQFWRCQNGAYRGDGAFGQYCIVLPERDTVIAITSGLKDMQAVLTLIWEKLLPALKNETFPADADAVAKLNTKLKSLQIHRQTSTAVAGDHFGKKFLFQPNGMKLEALQIEGDANGSDLTLILQVGGKEQKVKFTRDEWTKSRGGLGSMTDMAIGTHGAWSDSDSYTAKVCYYETPFIFTVRLKFLKDEVIFESETNVGFAGTKTSKLTGKIKPN